MREKPIQLSDHQGLLLGLAAMSNAIGTVPALGNTPEGKAIRKLLDQAVADGSEGAVGFAVGLLLAAAGAWERHLQAHGDSILHSYAEARLAVRGRGEA